MTALNGVSPSRPQTAIQALKKLACFDRLETECLTKIGRISSVLGYMAGDTVLASGQFDGTQLYGIASGSARLVKPAARAGDFDVTELEGGELVGLAEFLVYQDVMSSPLSLTALTDADVVIIDSVPFRELMDEDPELKDCMLRFAAAQWLQTTAVRWTDTGPDRRIYQHLLSLVQRDGDRYIISEMPRHAALAELCGTTDRDAAAAVAVLIDSEIARREYPGLVIEDISAFRAVCF